MWLLFATLSAVCFGFRGILYHWSSQKPMNRNLMLFGVFSTGAIVGLGGSFIFQQSWTPGVWMGLCMGTFSYAANASMYKGFAGGKASLVAILTGMTPVVVVFLAYFIWHETLSLWQMISFVVIVVGIIMVRYSNDISFSNLQGAGWGLLAMLLFGLNDLSSKQATLWDATIFPLAFMMFVTGAFWFYIGWRRDMALRRRASILIEPEPQRTKTEAQWSAIRTYCWGLVVGLSNISGMLLIIMAFKFGITGLVSAVVALNVLLFLLYSRWILKDKLSRLELAGVCFSIVGIMLLRILQ